MSRLLCIAIIALAAMCPAMALATAQIPDQIRIDGQDYEQERGQVGAPPIFRTG